MNSETGQADKIDEANTLTQAGEFHAAREIYEARLAEGECPAASFGLGVIASREGHLSEASAHLQKAISGAPEEPNYHMVLGDIERLAGRLESAEAHIVNALNLCPDSPQALNNLGLVYLDQKKSLEAIALFSLAIKLDPTIAMAHFNLGIAYRALNELDSAIAAYRCALGLNPDFIEAHVELALALLTDGQLEEGFEEFEWRQRLPHYVSSPQHMPLWDGMVDSQGSLLLIVDQGIGDTIQCMRYIPFIAREGMRIIIQCPPEMEELLQSVEGVASTYRPDEALPVCRGWLFMSSLPRFFQTRLDRIPKNVPYFQIPFGKRSRWNERLVSLGETLKVGVRWAGNPQNTHDKERSIPLSFFRGLKDIPHVTLISLAKDPLSPEEALLIDELKIHDFSSELETLVDTAALMCNLDLVISVDTAILHLAGALNTPVWGLLKFAPHWPWMLHRSDSPWYPSAYFFRQEKAGEWAPVLDRVIATLKSSVNTATQEPSSC